MLPFTFWMQLRESYPQFAQQNNQGMYMQQDAEECWTQLLYSLRDHLKVRALHRLARRGCASRACCPSASAAMLKHRLSSVCACMQDDSKAEGAADAALVQQLFGVGLHTRLVCEESGEAIEESSTAYQVKCNISLEVNHLSEGIRLGLQDDREKNSEALGRLALFKV